MAQSERAATTTDGLRIRGPHTHHDGTKEVEDLAGLTLRPLSGDDRFGLVEFGDDRDDHGSVTIRRDEIPKLVEALLEHADPGDRAYLEERTALALEELKDC